MACWDWLLPISGSPATRGWWQLVAQALCCPSRRPRCTQLVLAELLLNACLVHPGLVTSLAAGGAGCPGLGRWRGTLAQAVRSGRNPGSESRWGGHVSSHVGGPASPVSAEAYLGHELMCVWICLWSCHTGDPPLAHQPCAVVFGLAKRCLGARV